MFHFLRVASDVTGPFTINHPLMSTHIDITVCFSEPSFDENYGPGSVVGIATGWTVRRSNPGGGGEIFRTCPDRPWGSPSLLYSGYRVFPRGKERPGRDADPSPPSSAVVIKG